MLFHGIGLIAQLLLFSQKRDSDIHTGDWKYGAMLEKEEEGLQCEALLSTNQDDMVMTVDYHIENIVKIPPFLENPWGFSFKNTPFLLESMDHVSNPKEPSFSMQMRTSVCSTFELDCRGRAQHQCHNYSPCQTAGYVMPL